MINLSIITVTKNNPKELNITLNSIFNQTDKKNVELIIVNGGKKLKKNFKNKKFKVTVCEDTSTGIYNAMNQGSRLAKGNHLLFLNSGDSFYDNFVLENLKKYSLSKKISYFFICKVLAKNNSWNIPINEEKIFSADAVPVHQAILFNKFFYKKNLFNKQYHIAADYEYKLKLLKGNNIKFIPYILSNHVLGGVSSTYKFQNYIKISKELFLIDYAYKSFFVLLKNQINLLIKFILYQTGLNAVTDFILSKIYENKAYEIKI